MIIIPYINEVFILLSAITMAFGWRQIRLKRMQAHKRLMILGSVFAVLFFIGYALKALLVGNTTFGGPASLRAPYQAFLQVHSVLASVAAILGVVTIGLALKGVFRKHKKVGPWTLTIWFITALTGLVVFLLLYVIYPPGPQTVFVHSILGH